jgi:hypothetical protein
MTGAGLSGPDPEGRNCGADAEDSPDEASDVPRVLKALDDGIDMTLRSYQILLLRKAMKENVRGVFRCSSA